MFGSKIKLEKELLDKIEKYAGMAGYSSAQEFVVHTLEKTIAQLEEAESEEEVRKQLKGLGYLS